MHHSEKCMLDSDSTGGPEQQKCCFNTSLGGLFVMSLPSVVA